MVVAAADDGAGVKHLPVEGRHGVATVAGRGGRDGVCKGWFTSVGEPSPGNAPIEGGGISAEQAADRDTWPGVRAADVTDAKARCLMFFLSRSAGVTAAALAEPRTRGAENPAAGDITAIGEEMPGVAATIGDTCKQAEANQDVTFQVQHNTSGKMNSGVRTDAVQKRIQLKY